MCVNIVFMDLLSVLNMHWSRSGTWTLVRYNTWLRHMSNNTQKFHTWDHLIHKFVKGAVPTVEGSVR